MLYASNCCSTAFVCDKIHYLTATSYTVIFSLKMLFYSVQKPGGTYDKSTISGTEQESTAHLFETCFHSSHMIYRILPGVLSMFFAIVFLNCYFPLSLLITFSRQVITFFSLFDPNSDHPKKHLTCRSWIPRSSQNIIENR